MKVITCNNENLLDYIYKNQANNISQVMNIVKFSDNMMFSTTGFPMWWRV
jgi:hypothetical protein